MITARVSRVTQAIKEGVARILQHELKDPRIGFVTVTDVKLTADLEHATIYFSLLEGHGTLEETQAGLKSAQGFIRKLLGERLRIRITPEIIFRLDTTIAESIRISKIIDDIRKSEGAPKE